MCVFGERNLPPDRANLFLSFCLSLSLPKNREYKNQKKKKKKRNKIKRKKGKRENSVPDFLKDDNIFIHELGRAN